MTEPVYFSILGPIRAELNGSPLDLGSPKQRAVLAVLLINANTPMTSDQMIDALWGERPPSSATATLQAYISNLRKVLEPGRTRRGPSSVLQKNGAGYQASIAAEQLDSLCFADLIAQSESMIDSDPEGGLELVKKALDLWRGPALADFRYEDFAAAESTRLEEMRLAAIEMRMAAELTLGDARGVIPELENLTKGQPLREKLWEYLMVALYRAGRQAEALRAYGRCQAALAEVGIIPSQRLRELEQAIIDQDPGLLGDVRVNKPAPAKSPMLVGREDERALFEGCLADAQLGRASIILIEGEPGIGKTRLMETLEEVARGKGARTAFARCVEIGGTPPFWPWMQISRRLGTGNLIEAAGERARQLGPLLGELTEGPPVAHLFQLAEGLVHGLTELSQVRPVVLFIDDLYSADPDSIQLLTLLAVEIQRQSLVIVVSHRGPHPQASHPLNRFLADIARFDRVHRLLIRPFEPAEIADLAASMSHAPVDDAVIRAIFERTEGNVFFSREILRLLLEEGATGVEAAGSLLPGSVLEVVARRLDGLSSEALAMIRQAALFGRTFDWRIVAEVLALKQESSLRALDEILATGLAHETSTPGIFRFSHMIVVDSITQPLGALRRAQMHAQIADRLESLPDDGHARWVEIAHHRVRAIPLAGRTDAIAALSRAGEHAYLANAVGLAEDLFALRHQLVMDEPPSMLRDQMEIDSLFDLGRVWTWNEGFHSPRLAEAARRLWELTGIVGGEIQFDLDSPITSHDPVLASFQARFSVEIVSGDVNAAWKTSRRLLGLAETTPDPMIVYAANQTALTTLVHLGQVSEALTAVDRARDALLVLNPRHDNSLMLPMGQQPAWITYHSFTAWARTLAAADEDAEAETKAARDLCEASGNPFVAGFCSTIEGVIAGIRGEPEKVIDSQSWRQSVSQDPILGVVDDWLRLQRTWAVGMTGGDPLQAAGDMEEMILHLDRSGARVSHSLYWGLSAELALRGDQPDRALDLAMRGVEDGLTRGERFWYPQLEWFIAESLMRLGREQERFEAMERASTAAEKLGVALRTQRLGTPAQG